ncbi:MAG: fasciclin domain-containing protein [Runella slithyformis]|nr:MAG: fasciclin domain-containing protein [Runella slithyformis]
MTQEMRKFTAIIALILTTILGCRRDEPQPKSISDVLVQDEDFSILNAAISYAGLTDAFKTSYGFTFFAPTNAAFKASGFADASAVTTLPVGQVRSIIQYHLLRKKTLVKDFAAGLNYPTKTFSDTSTAYLSKLDGVVFINNSRALKADLEATNGVVHGVDRVLSVPTGDWNATIRNNPELSLAWAALDRALKLMPINPLLGQLNNRQEVFSFFLPNNKAMEAAGLSKTAIDRLPAATLNSFLLYHITRGRYFTGTLGTSNLSMLDSGRSVAVTVVPATKAVTLKGSGSAALANVVQTDLMATNGIIHVIDRVLVP